MTVNAAPRSPFCPVEIPRTAARCLLSISVAFVIASIAPLALDAQQRTIAVSGRVRDARSGEPVVAVSVLFDSVIVAATDETGRFQTPELQVGDPTVLLFFRRIGYATTVREIEVPELGAVVQVDVTLAQSPTGLDQIVVAGERVVLTNPGLAGFYERRELDFGRYLTEEEIDRSKGYDLTPQLRRLRVPIGLADLRDPFGKPTFEQCIIAYLDGIRLMDLSTINQWVPASHLAAIEFYGDERYHRLPGEFIPVGPFGEISAASSCSGARHRDDLPQSSSAVTSARSWPEIAAGVNSWVAESCFRFAVDLARCTSARPLTQDWVTRAIDGARSSISRCGPWATRLRGMRGQVLRW